MIIASCKITHPKFKKGGSMMYIDPIFIFKGIRLMKALVLIIFLLPNFAFAQTVIEEWHNVKIPPAPELKSVTVEANSTALLMLDFNKQTCNAERRPRGSASIPKVQKFLAEARAKGVFVVYSLSPGTTPANIVEELTPQRGELIVTSGPDKFHETELEKLLKERNVKTVIITGTSAHGAVLYTASGVALRGIKVIVPVDGMSADSLYPEQYTAWNLVNAPVISTQVTLSRTDMIKF
jgi:nicotinamidase-related amidase